MASTDLEDRYARLRGELVRAVRRICPGWLAGRADDMVQAALMRVLEIERRREGEAVFSSLYLRKAAHSALVDELRRLHRLQEVSLEGRGEGQAFNPAASGADPERHAGGREIGTAIRACLQRLVRPRRLATVLYLQGHSVPEVGRLLGWSMKRAENLVYRGLADLRVCLRARGAEP